MHKFLPTKEIVEYPNGGKIYFYVMDKTVIIVDEGSCKYFCNSSGFVAVLHNKLGVLPWK